MPTDPKVLMLTAMTLLGFYLCFKEMRGLAVEVASLRSRLGLRGAPAASAKPEGLARMIEKLRSAPSGSG